jgi:hypothetical protein
VYLFEGLDCCVIGRGKYSRMSILNTLGDLVCWLFSCLWGFIFFFLLLDEVRMGCIACGELMFYRNAY